MGGPASHAAFTGRWRRCLVRVAAPLAAVLLVLAGACSSAGSPAAGGGTEAAFSPATSLTASQASTTLSILRRRIAAAGVSGGQVSWAHGRVTVLLPEGHQATILLASLGDGGDLTFRPVLCDAPAYLPAATGSPAPGATAGAGALPACGRAYRLTRTGLGVDNATGMGHPVAADPAFAAIPSTTAGADAGAAGRGVLLPGIPGSGCTPRCVLGPAAVTDSAIASAQAQQVDGMWTLLLDFTPAGSAQWNRLARRQFHAEIGIDLDGTVISAPITQPAQAIFTSFGGRVAISGDLTAATARTLASDLRFGPLPEPLRLTWTRSIGVAGR